MSTREFEAMNQTPPLANSTAMKCIANLLADHTPRSQYMPSLFGRLGAGHYLTIQADGAKCYVAMSPAASPGATISELTTGNANTVSWPLPDGSLLPVVPVGGREQGTGIATLVSYDYLHYMTGATGVTSYLRVYRSSLAPAQGSEAFPAPAP